MKKRQGVYIILFNTILLLVLEILAHMKSGSVSILGEVFHMASDLVTVTVGLFGTFIATKYSGGVNYTFGLVRVEVLAAVASLILIWLPSIYVVNLSISRYFNPAAIDRDVVVITGFASLVINLVNFFVSLRMTKSRDTDMSVTSIYIHALSDLTQCIGVLVSGLVLYLDPSFVIVDLIAAVFSACVCFYGSLGLLREVLGMLLDKSPVDVNMVRMRIMKVDKVISVNDIRVWCISRGNRITMANITVENGAESEKILWECKKILRKEYSISLSCIEVHKE
ncbi:cobalt-zinc-cadmium efflux system protein [Nematocida ausubeli]|nr:cobalt-zinc-cadmium efflux system protein [Nematocida ausubeli]KAI5146913.1 cobalt-zinc-cadmium efflux system protein [Nematocida ausubeli]KAI5164371.1 cobalt-zinc-cadmium efflux system protein [Nematocida ausubeli]